MHISSRAVKSDTPSETSATAMSTAPDHEPAELAPKVGLLRSRIVGDQVGTKFWHLKRIFIYIYIHIQDPQTVIDVNRCACSVLVIPVVEDGWGIPRNCWTHYELRVEFWVY